MPKILLAGDVGGQLGALFKRVEAVSKKAGPFDALLCVGDFLGRPAAGQEGGEAGLEGCELAAFVAAGGKAPLPTYFIGALHPPHSLLLDALAASDCGIRYLGRRVGSAGSGARSGAIGAGGQRAARRTAAAGSSRLGCRALSKKAAARLPRIGAHPPAAVAGPASPTSAALLSPSWTACSSQSAGAAAAAAAAARPPTPAPTTAPRGGSAPRRTSCSCRGR